MDMPVPLDRLPRTLEVRPLGDREDSEQMARRRAVVIRRQYYDGVQYGTENVKAADEFAKDQENQFDPTWQRLPEHVRLHNYSDHVKESIDFLSDQISGQARIASMSEDEGQRERVNAWVENLFKRSGLENRRQELPRETMLAGDLFAHVVQAPHPDPDQPQVLWHLWEAESVEADYDDEDWQHLVEVRTEEHRTVIEDGKEVEKRYVHRYRLEELPIPLPPSQEIELDDFDEDEEVVFVKECVRILEVDGEFAELVSLGVPFIPWVHVHGENESLRSMFGRSFISGQVMETVDRYNAVCQLEFLASRYNSFGTAVVVGDEVYLRDRAQVEGGSYVVHKDIADILVFPGGTDVEALSLNIDTESFSHQQDLLTDEMFGLFGLERVDTEKIRSFGGVSGYALEILNRKTDGTFRRVVENQMDGYQKMFAMSFIIDAIVRASAEEFWLVDVEDEWPDRELEVDFGTAYIIDEVAVRDDFIAGLISQREALRKRGYSDVEIDEIMEEAAADAPVDDEAALQQGERFSTNRA